MEQSFFDQLGSDMLRQLLERTALQDAALLLIGPKLHVERCNEAAERLLRLRPLERADQILSESTVQAVHACMESGVAQSVPEELDGVYYRLEILPRQEGALLAYLRDGRYAPDGAQRVVTSKSIKYLGTLLATADTVPDEKTRRILRTQGLRLMRLMQHSEFLRDEQTTEAMHVKTEDLAGLVRETVEKTQARTNRTIMVQAPEHFPLLINARLVRVALYNLLTNAVCLTPPDGTVNVSLPDCDRLPVVTVSDCGPGIDAERFRLLVDGWQRPMTLEQFFSMTASGTEPGLGLAVAQRVAQLHHGALVFSPREGGGSEMHLALSRLPAVLEQMDAYAALEPETGLSVEETELSVL